MKAKTEIPGPAAVADVRRRRALEDGLAERVRTSMKEAMEDGRDDAFVPFVPFGDVDIVRAQAITEMVVQESRDAGWATCYVYRDGGVLLDWHPRPKGV